MNIPNPTNLFFLGGLCVKYPALCRTLEISFWTGILQALTQLSVYLTDGVMIDWRITVAAFCPAVIAGISKYIRDMEKSNSH